MKKVRKKITEIYKEIIFSDINKYNLHDDPEVAKSFLGKLFNDSNRGEYQFIILDHGGYFAPRIQDVLPQFNHHIVGIVEHTWNGEVRYRDRLAQEPINFQSPILSIAHSSLKGLESEAVANSIVDSLSVIIGGKGLNQSIYRLEQIVILGYGNIGKSIAEVLRKRLGESVVYICDISDKAQKEARKYFPANHVTGNKNKFLSQADLIITATSTKVLTCEDFSSLKSKAIIACATSSDDQLSDDALQNYNRITPTDSKQPCVEYQHKEDPEKLIYLAADGDSINFSIGSTSHPIIYMILASICVNAHRLIESLGSLSPGRITFAHPEDDQLIIKTYENIFGPLAKINEGQRNYLRLGKNQNASTLTVSTIKTDGAIEIAAKDISVESRICCDSVKLEGEQSIENHGNITAHSVEIEAPFIANNGKLLSEKINISAMECNINKNATVRATNGFRFFGEKLNCGDRLQCSQSSISAGSFYYEGETSPQTEFSTAVESDATNTIAMRTISPIYMENSVFNPKPVAKIIEELLKTVKP